MKNNEVLTDNVCRALIKIFFICLMVNLYYTCTEWYHYFGLIGFFMMGSAVHDAQRYMLRCHRLERELKDKNDA